MTEQKWTMPVRNWGIILNPFLTIYEKRVRLLTDTFIGIVSKISASQNHNIRRLFFQKVS